MSDKNVNLQNISEIFDYNTNPFNLENPYQDKLNFYPFELLINGKQENTIEKTRKEKQEEENYLNESKDRESKNNESENEEENEEKKEGREQLRGDSQEEQENVIKENLTFTSKMEIDDPNSNTNDISNNINKPDKMREDNISHKIRVLLIRNLRCLINKKYDKIIYKGKKNDKEFLLKIDSQLYRSSKIEEGLNFLDLKIKELFSKSLSPIYSKDKNRELNKENIEEFERNSKNYEGSEELISILNKTVEEMLYIYAKGESLDEDFNLENDLNKMREKMIKNKKNNIEEYIKKVREIAIEYRKKLNEKIGRNKEKK